MGAWGLYTTRGLSPFFAPAYAVEEMRQPNKVGVLLFSKFFASPQKTLVKWQIRRRKSQALSRENSDLYLSIHAWICLFTYHFCAHVWTQNMHIRMIIQTMIYKVYVIYICVCKYIHIYIYISVFINTRVCVCCMLCVRGVHGVLYHFVHV